MVFGPSSQPAVSKTKAGPHPSPPPATQVTTLGEECLAADIKTRVARGLADPKFSISRVPVGTGSLIIGLPPAAAEGSLKMFPSYPIQGEEWMVRLYPPSIPCVGSSARFVQGRLLPHGRQALLFFLPAWGRITSDQFVLKVVMQAYFLPL